MAAIVAKLANSGHSVANIDRSQEMQIHPDAPHKIFALDQRECPYYRLESNSVMRKESIDQIAVGSAYIGMEVL